MTRATQQILAEIEALPESERSALVIELARRVASEPHDLPNEHDLVAAADQVFLALDRREQEP
jgi:hypothetical protein